MSYTLETTKREATIAVLSRLGNANMAILKMHLKGDFGIDLDRDSSYTLEELQIALHEIMGAYGTTFLIHEIHNEMKVLAAELR